MKGEGQALAHGAVGILNAFSTGRGGALGVDLWTRARVTLRNAPGEISGLISTDPNENSKLSIAVVQKTLQHFGYERKVSGVVTTSSNIPTAVGLKSSSAAANAVALATASALGEDPDDDALLEIGVNASIECGVSLTGAYDDSFASYYGGAVLTDNERRTVRKNLRVPDDIQLLILVPPRKRYTGLLDRSSFGPIRRISELAYDEAMCGRIWDAITLNGLATSSILGEDPRPALSAIKEGALGAGLSGKGPAIVAAVEKDQARRVRDILAKFDGQVIETRPNFSMATVET